MLIRRVASWLALILASFAVVLVLAQLPKMEQKLDNRKPSVSVFEPAMSKRLTDDRLVDALTAFPLVNRPIKIGWDHGILAIDVRGDSADDLWRDMGALINYAYSDVDNVKQLLIRVFGANGDRKVLLLAAETRKSDWTYEELEELKRSAEAADFENSPNVRITLTQAGKRWIAIFAK